MANLRKIRIGTDITIALSVNVSGQPVTWKDGDIRHVYAFSDVQGQPVAEMAHKAEGKTLRCTYAAKDQNYTGAFRVIVEFASGEAFSSSLDVPAFEIVRTTEEADADTGEVVLDIDGTMRFYSLSEAIAKIEAATKAATDAAAAADKSAGNADAKAKAANDAAEKANAAAQAAGMTNSGIAKAEEQRVNAENARKEAELARSKAEAARASAEDKRAESDAKRAKAEAQRAAGEQSRVTAETGRVNAESARVKAESARDNAEETRAANEEQRKKNESARASAEDVRVEAEKGRVAAESARVAEFARLKTESETATKNATDAAEEAKEVSSGVAALERDLGQYAELPSVAMTAETTGKYINADGEFVDDADFNIAAIGAVVVGNTYELYMGSAAKMKLGVALFVARIRTTTTSGTERIEYVPLFSAMSTDIPTSGYVCFEAMEAYSDVLVCYRADVPEAATLRVRRYGTKASIATQINNLRKKVDLKSFADGYYESMRVGTADNLTSKGDATEEVIMSRKAGGDNQIEDGSASIKRIKGYSVISNQIFTSVEKDQTTNGVHLVTNDNVVRVTGTATEETSFTVGSINLTTRGTHKILMKGINGDSESSFRIFLYYYGFISSSSPIFSVNETKDITVTIRIANGCSINNEFNFQFIDLTQMFGSGNEPSTPDDFAKRLGYSSIDDVPYISYNEGEIVSSFAEGIKTSSRNLMKGLSEMEMFNSYFGFSLPTNSDYHLSLKKRNPLANTPKGSIGFIWDYDRQAKALWAVDDGVEKNLSFALRTSYYNNGKIIFGVYPQTLAQEFLATYEIQIEFGTEPTDYVQPQSWVRKWKNTIDKYFPDGLKSAGSVYDEITPTKAVKRIGQVKFSGKDSEAWESYPGAAHTWSIRIIEYGFKTLENNTTIFNWGFPRLSSKQIGVISGVYVDWTAALIITCMDIDTLSQFKEKLKSTPFVLNAAILKPEETAYDELNLTEQVAEGGTEEAIITDGKTSTPLRADIVYPIDAYNTIKANKTNIGTLSSLNTASKTDLVSAINELAGKVGALEAKAKESVTNETTE